MSTLLIRNAVVHTGVPGEPAAGMVAVRDGRVEQVGPDESAAERAYETADRVVDAGGALVAPAFVDAHVHSVLGGFLLTQLDLTGTGSLAETLAAVGRAAEGSDDIVVASGWDDSLWEERRAPTAAELESVAPGRQLLLNRLDGHSAVLSPALLRRIDGLEGLPGYHPDGHLRLDAMDHAVTALGRLIGPERRLEAARASMAAYAGQGIAAFHEAAAPHLGPSYEVALVRQAAAEAGLRATIYWGEHLALDKARELGVAGLAGDLNADGSIGSRTAALHTPYADTPGVTGHAYLTARQMAEHVVACTRAGVQAGFHCIGESGIETLTEGFRLAEKELGREAIRQAGHRLEHIEMPSPATIEMMADLGVHASMQPRFDELWGGPDQMYAERLGARWRGMNPVGALHRAGVNVALGSDVPVTRAEPWLTIRAACSHHEPEQRVDRETAFRMHTVGGWRAAGDRLAGELRVRAPAHLAIWHTELDGTLPPLDAEPRLAALFVAGEPVLEREGIR